MTERAADPTSAVDRSADERATGDETAAGVSVDAGDAGSGATSSGAPGSRRKRGLKNVRDMVISLAVIAVPIAFIVVIYPHNAHHVVHTVPYSVELRQVAGAAPFAVTAPNDLPSTWRATSVDYTAPAPTDATWHLGFVTPLGTYAALEQTSGDAKPLLDADASGVVADGTVTIDGQPWQRYTGGGHNALVHAAPRDTVIVAGSADLTELRALAGSLHTVERPTGASATSAAS